MYPAHKETRRFRYYLHPHLSTTPLDLLGIIQATVSDLSHGRSNPSEVLSEPPSLRDPISLWGYDWTGVSLFLPAVMALIGNYPIFQAGHFRDLRQILCAPPYMLFCSRSTDNKVPDECISCCQGSWEFHRPLSEACEMVPSPIRQKRGKIQPFLYYFFNFLLNFYFPFRNSLLCNS